MIEEFIATYYTGRNDTVFLFVSTTQTAGFASLSGSALPGS